ncbi:MAG: methyl-accepting chemotaxis protein [Selenomonadaceae bacterium]
MKWLNDLKVTQKLILLISFLMLAVVGIGGTGYHFLSKTNDSMVKMYEEKMAAVELANENRIHARRIEANLFALLQKTTDAESKALMDEMAARAKQFDENLTKLEQMPIDDNKRSEIKDIRDTLGKYREVRVKVIALAAQNKNEEAYTLYKNEGKAYSDSFTKKLIGLATESKKDAEEMNKQNEREFAFANTVFVSVIFLAVIVGLLLGWIIVKQISTRLNDVVKYLGILSTGDFSKAVSQSSLEDQSEFGSVSRAVDEMKNNVNSLIKQLGDAAQQLSASSEELTANAEQSAQASNQVAGSVTTVAEGAQRQLTLTDEANEIVHQISSAIQQVADNTGIVSDSAENTASKANEGEGAIKKAVSQMKIIEEKTNDTAMVICELEEKSKQIGQIVDAISNISGQTNLLALNAAIEAARAGEAGRGFSVVAEEVRKLAEQSQDAAKQITGLINEVQMKTNSAVEFMVMGKKEVDAGTQVVSLAGSSFEEILGMVRVMTLQISEISKAIADITSGTKKMVQAVDTIDQEGKKASEQTQTISAATEEQSASTEEIASASQHLASIAEDLQKAIQRFKI